MRVRVNLGLAFNHTYNNRDTMNTAMIWGASGGIGQALTDTLLNRDWEVIGLARNTDNVHPNAKLAIEVDIGNAFSVQSAILSASYEVDRVDLSIYAIGDILSAKIDQLEPDKWDQTLNANLTGAYLTTHYGLPLLAEDAGLIYIGAVSERLRLPGLSAYAAAKSGLEAFVDTVRKEQRRRSVMLVRPGAVNTPLWDKIPMRLPKDAADPGKAAERIIGAYLNEYQGVLDLT